MSNDDAELDYAYLAQNALRGVVRDVLSLTRELGAPPGDHHFYIEFMTHAPGVQIPGHLREQYPERMTIVLQHQFEALFVEPDHFGVTLHFNRVPAPLIIPYEAVSQFADPSVNFALQFPIDDSHPSVEDAAATDPSAHSAEVRSFGSHRKDAAKDDGPDDDGPDDRGPSGGSADVVSLDRFRKK
ncbi:SspB family protein [Parvularcula sp. LCG005]|uniref:SspB family protein n=1 Tax=Parvularcula sp. LCG005 TaxID=3078805 RepID=UPI00294356A7|nr:ClpXP protease specificity-enhancing factor SspB [Parvularcula sp. LCG005]WOI52282.1 ClpXP protease specificity-enhancing factor SspB [Parvularcula sp. LCG005]